MRSIQNWLERFCHKHPRLAIPNLMLYIVLGTGMVYLFDVFSMGSGSFSQFFVFDRNAILHGQIWRIFTFLFVPTGSNIILVAVSLYFYYFIGNALEREWGSAKLTIFYFFGVILNILVGLLVGYTTVFYINMALFFAFATLYPEMTVLLFFILPIKIKWLAWANAAFFAFEAIGYILQGHALLALLPLVAVLNYLLFFAGDLLDFVHRKSTQTAHRKQQKNRQTVDFQSAQQHAREKKGYLHKCAVCGCTDVTNPELEFRYCSKCSGYYCYCSEHINAHVHIE